MRRGDHIYVDLGSFKQHGIYHGDNRVIYWTKENSSEAVIRKTSLEEFSCGKIGNIKKRNYHHKFSSSNKVIKRAKRRLDESRLKYKFADSKAFAMYCKTGLHIGDHIYIDCDSYEHHGIYYDNDKVAHYIGTKKGTRISITSLRGFSSRRKIRIKRYRKCYQPKRVVGRAKRRLGEKKYHLIFNNCEHFARWCKTGRHKSEQVENPQDSSIKVIRHYTRRAVRFFEQTVS